MNAALLSIIYGQAIQPPAEPPTPLQVCPCTMYIGFCELLHEILQQLDHCDMLHRGIWCWS